MLINNLTNMKKIVFAGAAVLLLAAGCGKSASVQSNANTSTPPPGQTSLKTLMAAGRPQKCLVTYSMNGNATQGTIYLANGKMRGDFTSQVNGSPQTSHMINDGTTVYTWVEGMVMGMKMSEDASKSTSTPASSHSAAVDPDANEQYSCSAWSEDRAEFTAPVSINFSDMMQTNPALHPVVTPPAGASASASASMKAQECLACNNAGPNKAQCLAALSCN
jgi:hypothetical protein